MEPSPISLCYDNDGDNVITWDVDLGLEGNIIDMGWSLRLAQGYTIRRSDCVSIDNSQLDQDWTVLAEPRYGIFTAKCVGMFNERTHCCYMVGVVLSVESRGDDADTVLDHVLHMADCFGDLFDLVVKADIPDAYLVKGTYLRVAGLTMPNFTWSFDRLWVNMLSTNDLRLAIVDGFL